MTRGRILYKVGNENNPGDPFGRSQLTIELDGVARLVHHAPARGTASTWTARVVPAVLEAIWAGLDVAKFPFVAPHRIPAGATMRDLRVEVAGAAPQSAFIELRAATKVPGYAEAFKLLDQMIRQISGDSVPHVPASTETLVTDIAVA